MRCPSCGNENREGAKFCDSCGARLEGEPAEGHEVIAGRYEVQGFLGRGGRKGVYRATDREEGGRTVAVAVFETEGIGETAVARARREAQAMERLGHHPRIVSVLGSGEHDGAPFLVSEYMPGGDVHALLAESERGRLDPDRAIAIATDVCRALEHAHGHGIIHRDLKPANIWIGEDGRARLGDFGLAATERRSREAGEGTLIGTVAYLPPEQALGRRADARADLYSLGAVLYEMVAGQPPFTGDEAIAVISRHVSAQPPPPTRHAPETPAVLEGLILSLLAKSPDDRPESAAAARASLEAIAADPDAAASEHPSEEAESVAAGEIIGRERELEQTMAAVDEARGGRGNMLFLVGEPGIGKTRVAEELSTYARVRGARVIWGRCHEGDRAPSFWPWVEAIREYVRDADPVGLRWQLGARGPELAKLVDEIAELVGKSAETEADLDENGRFRLFDAVAGFLTDASRSRPLVVVLDDLHWADPSSLDLLKFTSAQLAGSGLLIVGTYRDVELGRHEALSTTLGDLAAGDRTQTLRLRGLDSDGVGAIIAASTGSEPSPALVRAVWERTEGNPFFVGEVVRLLLADGDLETGAAEQAVAIPQGARDAVSRRLEALRPETNELLAVAAVAGREFEPAVIEAASGKGEGDVARALSEAMEARIVSARATAPDWLSFAHAIVRETIYAGIETAERAALHRRVGEALEVAHTGDLDGFLDDLARHFAEAASDGHPEKAIDYSIRAAELATTRLAHEDAALDYARALELLGDGERERRLELGLALARSRYLGGRLAEGRQAYESAAATARELGDSAALAQAALGMALTAIAGVVDEPLAALLEEALEAVGPEDSTIRVELLGAIAGALIWSDPQGAARDAGTEALAIARRLGDDNALAAALIVEQFLLSGAPESPRERLANAEELIEVATRCDAAEFAIRGHAYRMHALLELGQVSDGEAAYESYKKTAKALRQPQHLWHVHVFRAVRLTMEGRFAEAERQADEGWRGGMRAQEPLADQLHALQIAVLRQLQGRLEEALPAVREMARRFPAIRAWQLTLSGFLAELGSVEEARAGFERQAANGFEDVQRDLQWVPSMIRLADTCYWLEDSERAAVLERMLEPYSGQVVVVGRAASCQGPVDLYLGRLAVVQGHHDEAIRRFEAAIELAERIGDRPFALEARYGLGRALAERARPHDRERALAEFTLALDGADAMGMRRLVERALVARLEVQGIGDIDVLTSIEAVVEAVGSERPDLSALAAGDGRVTILFSDIENSTLINERLGDERWLEVLRDHNAIFRRQLGDHGGYEVKSQGDGFMLAFAEPSEALCFAVDVQRDLRQSEVAGAETISVRMGMHTGEAIAEEGDLFGRSVVLAARIAAQATGGEILVSEAIQGACEDVEQAEYEFESGRELELKGLAGTHTVYRASYEPEPAVA